MILIDSYGWIEYFANGPLAESYAAFIEKANAENTITPTIVIYEVYKRIKSTRGEQKALEAYAQMSRTKIVELTGPLSLKAADISVTLDLGIADSTVVATTKAYNAEIVTSDEHLKSIESVKFISSIHPGSFSDSSFSSLIFYSQLSSHKDCIIEVCQVNSNDNEDYATDPLEPRQHLHYSFQR